VVFDNPSDLPGDPVDRRAGSAGPKFFLFSPGQLLVAENAAVSTRTPIPIVLETATLRR
jgi:hypothetical protein